MRGIKREREERETEDVGREENWRERAKKERGTID